MKSVLSACVLAVFFLTGCGSAEVKENKPETKNEPAETPKTGEVWTLKEELSGDVQETKNGEITFYTDNTVLVKSSDGTEFNYNYSRNDAEKKVKLTNVKMAEDVLDFNITESSATSQKWERLENDIMEVWTMTKK